MYIIQSHEARLSSRLALRALCICIHPVLRKQAFSIRSVCIYAWLYRSSKLTQESDIIFIQQSHIIDLIFQKSDSLKTYTKCKTGVLIRVDAAHFKYMRMHHTTAKDLDPAGSLTETAAFSTTLKAAYIYLRTGLCEREMDADGTWSWCSHRTALLRTLPEFLSGQRR